MVQYVLLWCPMLLLAIANGAIRDAWYKPALGDPAAHQLSTLTLLILFAGYFWWVARTWPFTSARQARTVGLLWLAMTVGFEFLFGRFVMGHPWGTLLHDYDVSAGRVWVLIPLWVALGPPLFHRLAGPVRPDGRSA